RADDRLDEERRDLGGVLGAYRLVEMVQRALRLFARVGGEERAAIRIRRPDVHDARHRAERLVEPAPVLAGERRGAGRGTVERAIAGEDLAAPGDRPRELHRVL